MKNAPHAQATFPPPSCIPQHPFAEDPPVPPETGAMPPRTLLMFPLNITHVSPQHYSCFPPTLLMFPLNMTNVYPRHDSCFRPALSAPPGRPCGVHRNFRAPSAPSAGAVSRFRNCCPDSPTYLDADRWPVSPRRSLCGVGALLAECAVL